MFSMPSLLSFFRKNPVTISPTSEGSHHRHWHVLFGNTIEHEMLIAYITREVTAGYLIPIDKNTMLVDASSIRGVLRNNELVTGFPYWKGSEYVQTTTYQIREWSHTGGIEAIVDVKHPKGYPLQFFALDYALNRTQYTQHKTLTLNVVGFSYGLEEFDVAQQNTGRTVQLSDDFCGFLPGETPDEIHFFGQLLSYKKHNLGAIAGYILTATLAVQNPIEIFIAEANLTIDLEKNINKHIAGLLWLVGTLEQ